MWKTGSPERRRSVAQEGVQAPLASLLGSTVRAMQPLPRVTGRDVVQALRRLGWVVVVQEGSHVQLRNPVRGGRVTVPVHAGETIGPGLLRSILAQAGLSRDEFRDAL